MIIGDSSHHVKASVDQDSIYNSLDPIFDIEIRVNRAPVFARDGLLRSKGEILMTNRRKKATWGPALLLARAATTGAVGRLIRRTEAI